MKKKFAIRGLIALSILLVLGLGILYYVGHGRGEFLKDWIGSRLQTVANWYLNPKLSFEHLDYQYPKTVVLTKLKLTSDDPAHPGQTVDVVACDKLTLELGTLPSVGKPLQIERIILDHPTLSAVSVEPGSAKFVGFSDLVKSSKSAPATTTEAKPVTKPETQPPGTKLSEVFQIRLIQLIEGKIVYNPRLPDTQPMELDAINTKMDISPSKDGWYQLSANLGRAPIFDLKAAGKLNLDTMATDALDVTLTAKLGREYDQSLPPQIQQLLKQYEVKGQLDLKLAGAVTLTDPTAGNIETSLTLTDAMVALGDYQIPVKLLTVPAKLSEGKATTPGITLEALDGKLTVAGTVILKDAMDTQVQLAIADMFAEKLLRKTPSGDTPPPFAGRVNAKIEVYVPLKAVMANAVPASTQPTSAPVATSMPSLHDNWGSGTIKIDQAVLAKIPVLAEIGSAMNGAISSVTGGGAAKPSDKVDVELAFSGPMVKLNKANVVSTVYAARATGNIYLDQRLDLTVNGGPVQKMESLLGDQIGGALGKVADALLRFKVSGTLNQVKITPEVGGGVVGANVGKIGEDAVKVGEKVGEGVGKVGAKVGEGVKDIGKGIGEGLNGIFGGKEEKK